MQRVRNYVVASVIALLLLPSTTSSQIQKLPPESSPTKFVKHKRSIPHLYIVVLNDNVVPEEASPKRRRARIAAIAKRHARAHQGKVYFIYETALKGYSISLPNEAAAIAISNLPEVKFVEEDALGDPDGQQKLN